MLQAAGRFREDTKWGKCLLPGSHFPVNKPVYFGSGRASRFGKALRTVATHQHVGSITETEWAA